MALNDEELTDDYIVSLLKRDTERSGRSRSRGRLFTERARPNTAARANVQFLRQMIRGVDSHNATMKRKETHESRARLNELDRRGAHSTSPTRKRKRCHEDSSDHTRKPMRSHSLRVVDVKKAQPNDSHRADEANQYRETGENKSRSHPPKNGEEMEERQLNAAQGLPQLHFQNCPQPCRAQDYDVENPALQNVPFGPAPPPRGRGANKQFNDTIDQRFDPAYNPSRDLPLTQGSVGDDWSPVLEVLQARRQRRAEGAHHPTATQSLRLESQAERSKRVDGPVVRWTQKGEAREWDRGKVDNEGRVEVRPFWVKGKNE